MPKTGLGKFHAAFILVVSICFAFNVVPACAEDKDNSPQLAVIVNSVENRPAGSFMAGDIIVELNGESLEKINDFRKLFETVIKKFEASEVSAEIIRNGKKINISETDFLNENKTIDYGMVRINPRYIKTEDFLKDIDLLIARIKESYVKYDVKEHEKFLEKFRTGLSAASKSEKISFNDAAKTLLRLSAGFGDGHFGLLLQDVSAALCYEMICNNRLLFPLDVEVDSRGVFAVHGGEKFRIESINGDRIEKIINEMSELLPKESKYFVNNELKVNFRFLYYILKGDRKNYIISATGAGGRKITLNLGGTCYSKLIQDNHAKRRDYDFKITGEVGILSINTFNFSEYSSSAYKNFLEKSFKCLEEKKIGKLIIDIRKNCGGNTDYSTMLLGRLTDGPVKYWNTCVVKCSKTAAEGGFVFEKGMKPGDVKKYDRNGEKMMSHKGASKYDGKIILLIGNSCFSTSLDFAVAFKKLDRGIVIGDNTGGRNESSDRGVLVKLHSCGFDFSIPAKYYVGVEIPNYDKDGTMSPDLKVSPEGDGIYSLEDETMKFALGKFQ